eukprot:TRINITY_DN32997_c0_g1_i1.p1 TRINITY_DN32997_c0_g1~~TRINITY_DN32997_c0_g1_i1.p1  ORF type:complete len:443 (+),score=89.53 TRINITY_DN32997_c0_g1_i1:38-1366(+)
MTVAMASRLSLAAVGLLQWLAGLLWAVQRPQGFLVLLFQEAGFSTAEVGIISACGLIAPIVAGPLVGLLADSTPREKRHLLFAAVVMLRALLQLSAWLALRHSGSQWAFYGVLLATVLQQACVSEGMLTEFSLRLVGVQDFGKVRLWGGVGFGMGSLLTGVLAEYAPGGIGLTVVFAENLLFSGLMAAILLGLNACATPTGEDVTEKETGSQVVASSSAGSSMEQLSRFLSTGHTVSFFLVVLALGLGEGVINSYTYMRLEQLPHGTSTVMGLTAVFMILSEIPFFYYAEPITRRFGVMPICAFALFCMAARQAWTSMLWDARWVLPGELLHGVTFSIANAAVVLHAHAIAPPSLETTVQSLVGSVFTGLGQGDAAWIGGVVSNVYGIVDLFRWSAMVSLGAAVSSLVLSAALSTKPGADGKLGKQGSEVAFQDSQEPLLGA